ncbi:DMT family transporter [Pseudomonas entomophila]|uniref:DMT family transporter n=1 Tax=Pseudomonas entomophila TaxID=312306 RepID=UPI0015E3075F|nr:DMT family transporter [Pseudomonas entomophila]MBA1195403.1 DMT family transporter [Pseudomonas entomophila]
MNSKPFWSLAMIAITAVWGWSFVAKQQSLHGMTASALNTWIFTIATLFLAPMAYASLKRLTRRDVLSGIAAGIMLFIAFAFQTSGIGLTTPSNAGFITGLSVVFTPILLFVLYRDRLTGPQWLGAAVALVGLGLLSLTDFALHLGDALILCCALFFAGHIVMLAKLPFSSTPLAFACLQMVTVAVLSGLWSTASGELSVPNDGDTWLILVLLGILGTGLAYFVQTQAQSLMHPQAVALILLFEPVFSGLFGYWLAGDRLTDLNLLGAVLILGGMLVSEFGAFAHGKLKRPARS